MAKMRLGAPKSYEDLPRYHATVECDATLLQSFDNSSHCCMRFKDMDLAGLKISSEEMLRVDFHLNCDDGAGLKRA